MLHVDLSCLEAFFFQICHTHPKLDLEMFMYASHIIPKYRYKLMVVPSYVTKKMMQTQVCKGSNHMFVIPQEKEKKCYTHVYTGSIDVSMKLDLNYA